MRLEVSESLVSECISQLKLVLWHFIRIVFVYLGFNVAFNTVQVISRRVVGRAEETSTYSSLGLCTVNCRPTASNYQLSHLSPCGDRTPASEVGGESVTTLPPWPLGISSETSTKWLPSILVSGLLETLWWNIITGILSVDVYSAGITFLLETYYKSE